MMSIKPHSKRLCIATIFLLSMISISNYSQKSGKVVERALCPRYMIVNDEIARKMDSVYSLVASKESVCLQRIHALSFVLSFVRTRSV